MHPIATKECISKWGFQEEDLLEIERRCICRTRKCAFQFNYLHMFVVQIRFLCVSVAQIVNVMITASIIIMLSIP